MTSDAGWPLSKTAPYYSTDRFFESSKSDVYLFEPPSQNTFRTPSPKTFFFRGGGLKQNFDILPASALGRWAWRAVALRGVGSSSLGLGGGSPNPGGRAAAVDADCWGVSRPPAGYSGRRAPGDCCWWGFADTLPGISFLEAHENCRSQHCPPELRKPPTVAIFTLFVLHQTILFIT